MTKQIRYNKLWKILVDRKLSKADLRRAIGAAPNTLTKLRRDEEVSMSILIRICEYLNCDIGDIVSLETVSDAAQATQI
jgi:DNA-binding Xre family transcriptional regulator